MEFKTINPATEEVIAHYHSLSEIAVEEKLRASFKAFLSWRHVEHRDRRTCLSKLALLLKKQKHQLAELITQEMGKPISQAEAEIEKCAWLCTHYSNHAENYLSAQIVKTEMKKTMVLYQPLGVVFAIMPWNFPFWQVFRSAVPALMAGNSFLLKHAPISIGAGIAIEKIFMEAGFPEYLLQHLVLDNDQAMSLLGHELVAGLSFTGSEQVGRRLAAIAGAHLKKMVLELGGSDPYVVLADADLTIAAQAIVQSRLNNCGQVCIAAKRAIVHRAVAKDLLEKIVLMMADYQMADPSRTDTQLGPMARQDLRQTLHQQVNQSIRQGAVLLAGGKIPERKGYYYPATLLTEVKPGMPAFDEELFGPVICLIEASDDEEAISLANQTPYGLGAAVFTRDLEKGEHIASTLIDAGTCFVNAIVASDPRLPFGGMKHSGLGRELAKEGILEFVNIKTVAIK